MIRNQIAIKDDMAQYFRSFSTNIHVRLRGTNSVSPSRRNFELLKPLQYNAISSYPKE
ncbi:MAG: hypothetical protein QMD44_01205 [Thermodesulfovibrionales bacterium]|nr:hypothetical protein [Thermodesulfovibrionales bacterium]